MLISIAEYAEKVNKNQSVVRKHCMTGKFKTAQKIGRNWVIDSEEEYIQERRERKKKKNKTPE